MKKILNTLAWIGGLLVVLVLLLLLVGVTGVLMTNTETNAKEQAYAEGQHDVITGKVNYTRLVKDTETDLDKEKKIAYAEGLKDATNGDMRIKSVNDTTYVWTKSPWDDKKEVPKDTIRFKK